MGLLGSADGPGSISLIQAVTVDGYHWMDHGQLREMLALPGPIATKLAAAIGWKVAGWIGAAAALLGILTPSLVLMLGFISSWPRSLHCRSDPWRQAYSRGAAGTLGGGFNSRELFLKSVGHGRRVCYGRSGGHPVPETVARARDFGFDGRRGIVLAGLMTEPCEH